MSSWTLRIDGPRGDDVRTLGERVHLVGSGSGCDVRVDGLQPEHLQLWRTDAGYRVVQMCPERVAIDGREVDEVELRGGEVLTFGAVRLVFAAADAGRREPASAPPPRPAVAPGPSAGPATPRGEDAFARLLAGAWLASAGKVRPPLRGKWEKVLRGSEAWDPVACAGELVDDVAEEPGVRKAAVHALRDGLAERLIRKARRATARKRFVARLIVQVFVFAVALVVVLAAQLAARHFLGIDWTAVFDGWLEGLGRLTGS